MIRLYDKVYDISVVLGAESIDYPGDTPYSRKLTRTVEDGGTCTLARLEMSSHAGTHIDTPAHFICGGRSIDRYDARRFILPAHVVSITDKEAVRPSECAHLDVRPGEALLFKTDNSVRGRCREGVFRQEFVYLTIETATWCTERGISLVGLDYVTVERYGDTAYPVHRALLGSDVLLLESIDLARVPPGTYTLFCLPLKIKDGEASPVRAVLVA